MSWIKGSNKRTNGDEAFHYWQYQSGAYWLLCEIDGYEFGGLRWWA